MREDPDPPRGVDMGPPPNWREIAAAALFAATLVAAAMLATWAPVAFSLLLNGAVREEAGAAALRFAVPYLTLIAGPVAGWLLWWKRRTLMALGIVAIVALAAWDLASATIG